MLSHLCLLQLNPTADPPCFYPQSKLSLPCQAIEVTRGLSGLLASQPGPHAQATQHTAAYAPSRAFREPLGGSSAPARPPSSLQLELTALGHVAMREALRRCCTGRASV